MYIFLTCLCLDFPYVIYKTLRSISSNKTFSVIIKCVIEISFCLHTRVLHNNLEESSYTTMVSSKPWFIRSEYYPPYVE